MRHRIDHRKLGRTTAHRRAMLRNMVTSLLEHEEIRTTTAKAKELRRGAEKMITLRQKGTLAARRRVPTFGRSKAGQTDRFHVRANRYGTRPGGYTRQ